VVRHPFRAAGVVLAVVVLAGGGLWLARRVPGAGADPEPTRFIDPLARAREAIAVRNFAEAKDQLRGFLQTSPQHAEALILLAQTCRRTGDFDGWRRNLERAESAGCPAPRVEQERYLFGMQTGKVRGVNPILESYLDSHPPEEVLILELLAQSYLDHNLLPDAVRLTNRWIERHPDDPLAYLDRGRATLILERDQATLALKDFRRALELSPELADARLALARAYRKERRWPEALEAFQAFLRLQPGDPRALLGVAECQLSLSEPAAATAALDALPAKDKNTAAACVLRSKLAWVGGKPDDTIRWLKRAEQAAPSNLEVVRTLGLVLLQTDHPAQADQYHRRFDVLDREQSRLTGLAVQIMKEPRDVELRYRAALANRDLGRDREAENCFQAALWLDPNHGPSLTAYADLLAKQGKADRAAALRRRAGPHAAETGQGP
jgi:tetratricopeptide (TPR) repeat protein